MKSTVALLAVMFCLAGCSPEPAEPESVLLVEDGKAQAVIILPEKPDELEQLAAEEIATYAEKISGAKLPIISAEADGPDPGSVRIMIGSAALAKPGSDDAEAISVEDIEKAKGDRANTLYDPDGFVLVVEPGCIALAGVRPQAPVPAGSFPA